MANNENRKDELDKRNKEELSQKMDLANRVVSKKYLFDLSNLEVKPLDICIAEDVVSSLILTGESDITQEKVAKKIESEKKLLMDNTNYQFMKLSRFVFSDEEDIIQKLSTVYASLSGIGGNIVFIIDSKDGEKVDIYIGVQDFSGDTATKFNILNNSLLGNFPGTLCDNNEMISSEMDEIRQKIQGDQSYKSLAIVSGIANEREQKNAEKKSFIQGLEKYIDSMKMCQIKQPYTAVIIAESISYNEIEEIESGYEDIYSAISSSQKSVISTSVSNSNAISRSITNGTSSSITEGMTKTSTHTTGKFSSNSVGLNGSLQNSVSDGVSKVTGAAAGKIVQGVLGAGLGALLGPAGAFIGNAAGGLISEAMTKTITHTVTKTVGGGVNASHTWGTNVSDSISEAQSKQNTSGEHKDITKGNTDTITNGTSLQIESIDKTIVRLMEKIDLQLERIRNGIPYGMFNCCAYFMSSDKETTMAAANTYKALLMGEKSSVEIAAVNYFETEHEDEDKTKINSSIERLKEYLYLYKHPVFYLPETNTSTIEISPASVVNGMELPLYMGIPQKSVSGLSVVEQTAFGRNIQISDYLDETEKTKKDASKMFLGDIYHMSHKDGDKAWVDKNMLTSHMFISGSTGTGKTNAVFNIISSDKLNSINKLIIEPAKGEYKRIFGDYNVYGTNSSITELLRLNPFSFPAIKKEGTEEPIHVLEHIDRLVEIFNACWPMYAAMPAVLKDSIEKAYVKVGWDLKNSKCKGELLFPTFIDLLDSLTHIMDDSFYSKDTKSDYIGALLTRTKSLTNGINGLIFCSDNELSDEDLFENNVIVDLSRVGAVETKSLMMGILVMKLQEYRLSKANLCESLEHITIMEEAHNLLRKTSYNQSQEGSNLQGKSVEMITNSIAELRAFGEAFMIIDQAPSLLDDAVIRNTNTKLIFRLPEAEDREKVGKSMALKDNQIDDIAKLPKGVGVLYQNDWVEAVLCRFDKYGEKKEYTKPDNNEENIFEGVDVSDLLTMALSERTDIEIDEKRKSILLAWINNMNVVNSSKRLLKKVLAGNSLSENERLELCYNAFGGQKVANLLLESIDDANTICLVDAMISQELQVENKTLVENIRDNIIQKASEVKIASDLPSRYKMYMGGHTC